ncbi:hypothetical protein BGZ83_008527 [Gryganskiella cystojenkinii]|nr:hypothetical protein BGZ83_008527 [Gryganskiella cystojenkinii]
MNAEGRTTINQSAMSSASGQDQHPDDYIPLVSDAESDVEIDLHTRPPKKTSSAAPPKVPKHFRKSNDKIYDNISVYAPPDSNLIFRCSQKRADWYLSRNLARVLSPTSIHLTFAPGGQGRVNDPYYLEERENKCVICGRETCEVGATMLHVVPEQYRKWFPLRMKSHASHDIVVACPECNANWDREAAVVRKKIVGIYNVPLEGVGWVKDYAAGAAKRAAGAIVADWNRRWSDHQAVQGTVMSKSGATSASQGQSQALSGGGNKQSKVKKQAIIPPERIRVLEQTVLDWWAQTHNDFNDKDDKDTGSRNSKRESEASMVSSTSENEPRKRQRHDGGLEAVTHTPSSLDITTQLSIAEVKPLLPTVDVPLPPPGVVTIVEPKMLREALIAEALYKAEDYMEHGQLVVAQVMASSPEFHEDKNESQATLQSWREAQPLEPLTEGWTDVAAFVRSWRRAFLEKTKPQYLSSEWRVDNPVQ